MNDKNGVSSASELCPPSSFTIQMTNVQMTQLLPSAEAILSNMLLLLFGHKGSEREEAWLKAEYSRNYVICVLDCHNTTVSGILLNNNLLANVDIGVTPVEGLC